MTEYKPGTYTNAFNNYLQNAKVTPFDFWLTVQDVGTAEALRLVEKKIRERNEP